MLVLMALQRISYLGPAVISSASPIYHSTPVNLALLLGTAGWNTFLFWRSARHGWFPPALVCVDVTVAVLLFALVGGNLPLHAGGAAANWADGMGQATAALAGAAIGRMSLAVAGVSALVVAQAWVTGTHDAGTGDAVMEMVHAVNGLVCFAVVVRFAVRYLRREGRHLDRVTTQRLVAESARAAERAEYATRLAHHQALHDTVLTTLTIIARGAVAPDGEQIRQRCAHDADYIRRLLADEASAGFGTVTGALHEVVGGAELLGLRVHYRGDRLPDRLRREAVDAVRDATREALNNVVKHADVAAAWVTATWDDGELRVTVVDRGRGFHPDEVTPGFGLRHSIVDRLAAVGGRARISSAPGEGTCVELSCRG